MTVASGCKYDGSNYRENSVFLNLKAMNKYIAGTVSFIYLFFFFFRIKKVSTYNVCGDNYLSSD